MFLGPSDSPSDSLLIAVQPIRLLIAVQPMQTLEPHERDSQHHMYAYTEC